MTKSLYSRHRASKGAALIIVLAFVVLVTALAVAHFSRTTTDRQLAQSSFNDTSADLLARSALDITVSDLKQEIINDNNNGPVTAANIQPAQYGVPPITDPTPIPNLIRRSFSGDSRSRASTVSSGAASANGRSISLARWNSHYLIPRASTTNSIDSTPVSSFTAPDWVLVTAQGPKPTPLPSTVIGRYAFAVYDEGGLIDMNVGGFPTYANLTLPIRRRVAPKYPLEESEILLAACQSPNINSPLTDSGTAGTAYTYSIRANHSPTSYNAVPLPAGLVVNTATGVISGTPTDVGVYRVRITAANECGSDTQTLTLTLTGAVSPDSTPWPINRARKGIVAFADITALPSTPTFLVITPPTPATSMGGFPSTTQINKLMGWRNHATTGQGSASFNSPSFPLASADNYARYFLGSTTPPYTTRFTTVSTSVGADGLTDQAVMSRQELIKLQRTLDNPPGQFPQSLLQYLGTFSREQNRPAPDWLELSGKLPVRIDMNNFAIVIPDSWIAHPHGRGHAWGLLRHSDLGRLFGLTWLNGDPVTYPRTDPRYWGRWSYVGHLRDSGGPLTGPDPDFFQIIDYAMNQAIGVNDPNHMRNTFNIGAALIDQYDSDDLNDPDNGNIITIIAYGADDGTPANYAYGMENMSFDDPTVNLSRPPSAPTPPAGYVLLNRRFENVGEFGYAYNPASTTTSHTLDFASSTSHDRALLDFFTYNTAGQPSKGTGIARAGIVNLNTRNCPVLASIIKGALLNDAGSEVPPTALLSQTSDALNAAQAIVQETTSTTLGRGPALTRADVARLAAAAAAALPVVPGASVDEVNQTIARALAEVGQARTWNLMIDVIAQTGQYAPGTNDLTDPSKFIVQGEKRYWLHIALDRDDGTVLGTQLEEVVE